MSSKHDLTVKSNGIINFQVGLITSMLLVIFFLNLKTVSASPITSKVEIDPDDTPYSMTEVRVEKEKKEQLKQNELKKKAPSQKPPTVVPDHTPDVDVDDFLNQDQPTTDEPKFNEPIPESVVPISIVVVEEVPIFPGCETMTDNKGRIQCLSENITSIIQKYFNADLGADLGLKGEHVIYTTFSIDQQGEVVKIKARAPHKKLEEEAKRVISKIPVMTPGNHNGNAVEVLYSVPIRLNLN
ncbi:hypothetical protein GCM10009117_06250 [Gangjinia marincola]|uniref:TonB C-terminal domain-containing protein n=1 Tax=Gangjinia marincola TaxID=578463 RepID=A0ABN3KE32_9FLAO